MLSRSEAPASTTTGASTRTADGHAATAIALRELGISHVYGIPGIPVYETFAACVDQGLRAVTTRHQQAAGLMAAAQSYLEGRLSAAALVSSGPAVTNLATALLVARDNGWPLLALAGPRPSKLPGGFQELDAVPVYRPITKWAERLSDASEIGPALRHAHALAMEGRPGPVYLELTHEVLLQRREPRSDAGAHPATPAPHADRGAVRRAAEILMTARRPAVLVGEAIRWSEPYPELAQLVDRLDAPFAPSPLGRGYLPDDHPRCCDKVRAAMLASADVVVLVGVMLDWVFRFGAEIPRSARLVQIASHEGQVATGPTPEVVLMGNIRAALQLLLEEVDPARLVPDRGWREGLERTRREAEDHWEAVARQPGAISPLRLMVEVRNALPRDVITVLDGNVTLAAGQLLLPSYLPASRMTPGHDGCMGVGLPFGVAAKLCHPGRPVVVVSGDFAFGLNAMEMETAVRCRIPVVVLVANNDGNGGGVLQRAFYPRSPDPITMFGRDIHYDRMMTAFGGYGEYVDRAEEIGPALKRALASGLPACINVRVDPEAPYPR